MVEKIKPIAYDAIKKYCVERDIAAYIKKECDKQIGKTWHCVVGNKFGLYVTYEAKHYIYFSIEPVSVLLFKTT